MGSENWGFNFRAKRFWFMEGAISGRWMRMDGVDSLSVALVGPGIFLATSLYGPLELVQWINPQPNRCLCFYFYNFINKNIIIIFDPITPNFTTSKFNCIVHLSLTYFRIFRFIFRILLIKIIILK